MVLENINLEIKSGETIELSEEQVQQKHPLSS